MSELSHDTWYFYADRFHISRNGRPRHCIHETSFEGTRIREWNAPSRIRFGTIFLGIKIKYRKSWNPGCFSFSEDIPADLESPASRSEMMEKNRLLSHVEKIFPVCFSFSGNIPADLESPASRKIRIGNGEEKISIILISFTTKKSAIRLIVIQTRGFSTYGKVLDKYATALRMFLS
ncbi:9207_t:CDS:2 [Funneliformis mosseae]|uniref:9207_t:CDS:1 n=1 Tax=Funneliformis mosseae TaxID=27381 RepID=A0A9N9DG33_FUNMO|nr:9207_t:CDS:2 [Funneliformis mosseae]